VTALRRDGTVDPDELAALEEQRDFLLRSIDDLEREREAGELDDDDYRTLRDDYTARAAAVLRAIEEGRAALPARRPAGSRRTILAVLAVLVLAAVAGLAVAGASGTRLAGDFGTGEIRETSVGKLRRAAQLAGQGEALEAIKLYDEVLAADPDNPQALTYRGWLLFNVGRTTGESDLLDRGRIGLERAIASDPDYPDARFFYGFVLLRHLDDPAGAAESFVRVLAARPGGMLEQEAQRALEEIEATTDVVIPRGTVPPATDP
jgi:tetratricopeptide (TPR) repeat protein